MKVYEKLLEARQIIKSAKPEKNGKNKFSNYDYFTPSYVSNMVNHACKKVGLLTLFSLKHDELGLYGELRIVNIEDSSDDLLLEMRTEKPDIKATNLTQQMGGCETYTKRYLLMSAFDLCDDSLDFDSQDNTKSKPTLTKQQYEATLQATPAQIKTVLEKYQINKAWKSNLENLLHAKEKLS